MLPSTWSNIFHTEVQKSMFKATHECNFTFSQIQACGWAAQGWRVWSTNDTDRPSVSHLDIIKKKPQKTISVQINIMLST